MNQHNFAAMREAMIVSQLRTSAVSDPRVIAAFQAVPRESFVPDARAALAYVDIAIPLDDGRALNAPLATARLMNEAGIAPTDHVLLIGAATGYATAVLSALAADVVAVEESESLAKSAKAQLKAFANVTLINGGLVAGSKKQAPYDVIMIDGAVEHVPDAIIAQLKVGGRLVTGLVERGVTRLASGHKSAGGFGLVPFIDMDCVVLPGFAKVKVFSFA